jgi:hypothetical protein
VDPDSCAEPIGILVGISHVVLMRKQNVGETTHTLEGLALGVSPASDVFVKLHDSVTAFTQQGVCRGSFDSGAGGSPRYTDWSI